MFVSCIHHFSSVLLYHKDILCINRSHMQQYTTVQDAYDQLHRVSLMPSRTFHQWVWEKHNIFLCILWSAEGENGHEPQCNFHVDNLKSKWPSSYWNRFVEYCLSHGEIIIYYYEPLQIKKSLHLNFRWMKRGWRVNRSPFTFCQYLVPSGELADHSSSSLYLWNRNIWGLSVEITFIGALHFRHSLAIYLYKKKKYFQINLIR